MEQIRTCTRCKKNYDLEHYTKGNKILKQCLDCRNYHKRCRNNPKRVVKGICHHHRRKACCKLCSDPIDITIKHMIQGSKQTDIKYNRYDKLNFVNYNYLKKLILDSNNICCYCGCDLQYRHCISTLGTIERLNNSLGHNIGNCTIACRNCNISRVGNTINPQL